MPSEDGSNASIYSAPDKLKDGAPVLVRAIRPDDKGSILGAFKGLDLGSIYTRFFTCKMDRTDSNLRGITNVDFENVVALLVPQLVSVMITAESGLAA